MADVVRVRSDAWTLSKQDDWHPTLLWYARAVAEMQTRPLADPSSWRYQAAIHEYNRATDPLQQPGEPLPSNVDQVRFWTQCQHGSWFFLSWHRMYLSCFERIVMKTIVELGGPDDWALPYWNYSDTRNKDAGKLPPAFRFATTPDGVPNPLRIRERRTGVNNGTFNPGPFRVDISTCLGETQFEGDPTGGDPGFGGPQTGFSHSGVPGLPMGALEGTPHGSMHVAVGGPVGWMSSFDTAALDPIFWLHHANIDRLWHAWALPDGKNMPWWQDPYWSGTYNFGSNITVQRSLTYHISWLNYTYDNLNKPTSFPPNVQAARMIRVQARAGDNGGVPAVVPFTPTNPKEIGQGRISLGGVRGVALGDSPLSIRIPLDASGSKHMQSVIAKAKHESEQVPTPYKSAQIVFEDVNQVGGGKDAGFFYYVYVNLPAGFNASTSQQRHLIGTLGAFEIAGAAHHGPARFAFPATIQLADAAPGTLQDVTISLVRVNGDNTPKGQTVLNVSEIRLEVSTDEPAAAPGLMKPASECYC
jgi:tyrosinase